MIYLDNAATTPLSERAAKEQVLWACERFYNPSATYVQATKVAFALTEARGRLKKLLGVKDGEIIFTGGATEANNLAIRGSVREGKWEYVFSSAEHASVDNLAKALEREGREIKFVPIKKTGEVDLEKLEEVLNEKTRLVSCMFVNNVTGAVNDVAAIAKIIRKKAPKAIFHVDGVQAFCKLPFKLSNLDVDAFSLSAHKFHGPKGVGGLYIKNKAGLKNLVYGGGQEFGIRSGTENVPGIMAMLTAAEELDVEGRLEKVEFLKQAFLSELEGEGIELVKTNRSSPYIATFIFSGVNGETLVRMLENDVIVGRGSACSAKKSGNHVLEAMGYSLDQIKGAIRVSFDAALSEQEVRDAAKIVKQKYYELVEKLK